MPAKQLLIYNPYNFGLALNSATRMYRREPKQDVLTAVSSLFNALLPYLDDRTLFCSAEDLQVDAADAYESIPEDQQKEFCELRELLMMECFNREMEDYSEEYNKERRLIPMAYTMRCLSSGYPREALFKTEAEFWNWVTERLGPSRKYRGETVTEISITKELLPAFRKICLLMVQYSVGRQTYMPGTSAGFVVLNRHLLDTATKTAICEAVAGDRDSCWIRVREKFERRK